MKNKITIAVAGNPNSGKTTLFNSITGASQKVGNWSGVTVEKVEGKRKYGDKTLDFVDLPGTYSLSAFSPEEKIARDFLLYEHPDVVLAVIDASHLERNLYLIAQIIDIGHPAVIALNMFDLAKKQGDEIDVEKMSDILGIPVIPTIGIKGIGIEKVIDALVDVSEKQIHPKPLMYPDDIEDSLATIDDALRCFKVEGFVPKCHLLRYVMTRLLEEDPEIYSEVIYKSKNSTDNVKIIQNERRKLEKLYNDDIHTILAQARFAWATGLFEETVKINKKNSYNSLTDKFDDLVLNRWLGFPIFAGIMFAIFYLTFTVGGFLAGYLDQFFSWLGDITFSFLTVHFNSTLFASLISEGIIGGVGGIVVFLPNIFILFLLIAILEDSGYIARAAFIMDRLMHKFGLHGRSFIPLLLGFGCSIPAILSTRTLRDPRDRLSTMLVIPFVPCSARLPVLIIFAGLLFPKNPSIVVFSMYFLGIVVALLVALVLKKIFFGGLASPFVMELPKYHFPAWRIIFKHTAIHSGAFLRKAGTVILLGAILVWILGSLPAGVQYGSENSYAGKLGKIIQPVFTLQHIQWQGVVALTFGFVAKEIVISSLTVLYQTDKAELPDKLATDFPIPVAWAFLVFAMLYTPCIATLAAIKAETGKFKWVFLSAGMSLGVAWILALLTYITASIL
ncbi:ferrous iron transport protein B [bacterium]|nr:ferrous iron transport protein B [bacterium]